jgi:hypothetical protein
MQVLGVRGSGEHSGFGPTIGSLVSAVLKLDSTARADTIDYPAVAVNPEELTYNANYVKSVDQGAAALRAFIGSSIRHCSNTYIFLAGYSQGAEVIDDVIQGLATQQRERIGGVALFGDPRFNPGQVASVDVGSYNHSLSGVAPHQFHPPDGTFGTLIRYAASDSAIVRSYCANHDPVCNYSSLPALVACAAHSDCAHLHYGGLTFDAGETYTQAAAAFLVARWRAVTQPTGGDTAGTSQNGASGPRSIEFDLTTPAGWKYAGSLPLPVERVTLSKDIRSSPPGFAQLSASVRGDSIESVTFSDVNPGRPDGPKLNVSPGYLAYPWPAALNGANGDNIPEVFGPCQLADNDDYDFEPFDADVDCQIPTAASSSSGTSSDEGSESQIDTLIADLRNVHPTYVVDLSSVTNACGVFVSPSGHITESATFQSWGCGTLSIKLS